MTPNSTNVVVVVVVLVVVDTIRICGTAELLVHFTDSFGSLSSSFSREILSNVQAMIALQFCIFIYEFTNFLELQSRNAKL